MKPFEFTTNTLRRYCGFQMPPLGPWGLRAFSAIAPNQINCELFPKVFANLDLRDETQRSAYWLGTRFEFPTGAILQRWTEPRDSVFFDIGSNFGLFSFFLLSKHSHIKVYSFEPNPRAFATLSKISAENSLFLRHKPVNIAIGRETSEEVLYLGKKDSGHSTLGKHPYLRDNSSIEVVVRNLPDWLAEEAIPWPEKPAWVAKIDVEGYELQVLQGLRPLLERKCFRGVCIEINPFTLNFCNSTSGEIRSLLQEVGYAPETKIPEVQDRRFQTCGNEFYCPA
jgi:FkbM family methyltransferase